MDYLNRTRIRESQMSQSLASHRLTPNIVKGSQHRQYSHRTSCTPYSHFTLLSSNDQISSSSPSSCDNFSAFIEAAPYPLLLNVLVISFIVCAFLTGRYISPDPYWKAFSLPSIVLRLVHHESSIPSRLLVSHISGRAKSISRYIASHIFQPFLTLRSGLPNFV